MKMTSTLTVFALTTSLLLGQAWAKPFQAKVDLKRCMVGNQAGLLKVLTPERKVAYTRGIDDRSLAQMSDSDRTALLAPLGIEPGNYGRVAQQLMNDYAKLPARETIAVLGTLAGSAEMDDPTRDRLEPFLVQVMRSDKNVQARRQAILALATLPRVQAHTVADVVAHYESCQNLWETFPVQQFVEYHAQDIRKAADFAQLRARMAAVESLYTPALLGYLESSI